MLKFASHLFAGLLDLASHDKLIQDQVHLQRYRSITERCDMKATGPQACCAVSIILFKKGLSWASQALWQHYMLHKQVKALL